MPRGRKESPATPALAVSTDSLDQLVIVSMNRQESKSLSRDLRGRSSHEVLGQVAPIKQGTAAQYSRTTIGPSEWDSH